MIPNNYNVIKRIRKDIEFLLGDYVMIFYQRHNISNIQYIFNIFIYFLYIYIIIIFRMYYIRLYIMIYGII